jgi:hypothetical protein
MNSKESNQNNVLKALILKFIVEKKPETVEDLIDMILTQKTVNKKLLIENIMTLRKEGKLSFKEKPKIAYLSFQNFLSSSESLWFWIILALTLSSGIIITITPIDGSQFIYTRYLFGFLFVTFLPGYSFVKAIFTKKEIGHLEQIVFSIVLSITFDVLLGLFLNYTPWGITLIPLVLGLLSITLLFAIIGVIREFSIIRG